MVGVVVVVVDGDDVDGIKGERGEGKVGLHVDITRGGVFVFGRRSLRWVARDLKQKRSNRNVLISGSTSSY